MRCTHLFLLLGALYTGATSDDYYKLLNVPRDATVQEIRKAFKILAVKLHPDKNKDDALAEQKFIKIAKAYEVLKDPTSRKQYDVYGDSEFNKDTKQSYHSYSYYKDHFGIYDDDPIIVTLSSHDYEVNILDANQAWFVNFYSPHCHHCHDMAPIWRQLANELEGVVRIAAVNCEEDYPLCHQLSIEAYPTLLFYEKEAHLYEGQKYRGPTTVEALQDYVLSKVRVDIKEITKAVWDSSKNGQWVLFLCTKDSLNCPEKATIKKVAATLDGLLHVGTVKDAELCDAILDAYESHPLVFWQIDKGIPKVHIIDGSDSKEIVDKILNILPTPPLLDEAKFHDLRTKLRLGFDKPWLICFYLGAATDLKLELKRLPTVISNINIGLVHCGKSAGLCAALHIVRYPTWCVLKQGGAFEVHQGRDVLHEVAAFARDSSRSTNLHALSPADFIHLRRDGAPWYIDWYAPWCPPCKRLTPELRKASQHFEPEVVQFGTVDCTVHKDLCAKQSINSYPTMVLYNGSNVQRFHGTPNEASIVEFVQDAISPVVLSLDDSNFSLLARKSARELWVVDFFAPWCGPCQQLTPQYRKFAKSVSQFENIVVAQVDCAAHGALCDSQNVRGYPTIRLYPLGSKGLGTVAMYNGQRDAISLKRWAVSFLPTKVEALDEAAFKEQILKKSFYLPWLVDFYAPWCGHCVHFEPEFAVVAQRLDGKVRSGKVDCEANRVFCGHQRVTGYPTVRLYLSPNEYVDIERQDANEMVKNVKRVLTERRHDEL